LRDRVLWGLQYAAGLRTSGALALGWSDVIGLDGPDPRLAIDREFVAGQLREANKTGKGRDVAIVGSLAADLIELRETAPDSIESDLVCPSRAGTPMHLENWRGRVFDPAAERAGVPWATPYTSRHTYISRQVRTGIDPRTVAPWAGNSQEVIWRHYSREFDRSQATTRLPLADAPTIARQAVAEHGGTPVRPADRDPIIAIKRREGETGLLMALWTTRAAGFEPATFGSGAHIWSTRWDSRAIEIRTFIRDLAHSGSVGFSTVPPVPWGRADVVRT
jgi:hypothetical protein